MNLVIQSLEPIADSHLKPLAALARSQQTERADAEGRVVRLLGADPQQRPDIDAYCNAHRLDYAFIDPALRLSDFGLVAMDMDSTLITIECIDEIADFCGLKAQVAAITEASMRGEIKDFNESLTRRVALLKGLDASALEFLGCASARQDGPKDRAVEVEPETGPAETDKAQVVVAIEIE